jgi:hypothetical protein
MAGIARDAAGDAATVAAPAPAPSVTSPPTFPRGSVDPARRRTDRQLRIRGGGGGARRRRCARHRRSNRRQRSAGLRRGPRGRSAFRPSPGLRGRWRRRLVCDAGRRAHRAGRVRRVRRDLRRGRRDRLVHRRRAHPGVLVAADLVREPRAPPKPKAPADPEGAAGVAKAGSRRNPPSHARGSAAHPGSAGWHAPPPRRPASRTPGRSPRRGSSGPPPPSPDP